MLEFLVARGAYPSPLGYMGFPRTSSASVNECVCHGIPDNRPLEDGDVVSLDVSCFVGGFHGDNCGTFHVGNVDAATADLVSVAKECLDVSIDVCGDGVPLSEIGRLCMIASENGCSVVASFQVTALGRTSTSYRMYPVLDARAKSFKKGWSLQLNPSLSWALIHPSACGMTAGLQSPERGAELPI